jgi:hypothetical protein
MPGKTPSKLQHYAIIGRTLLLRDCPLRSQPLLVLPWTTNEQGNVVLAVCGQRTYCEPDAMRLSIWYSSLEWSCVAIDMEQQRRPIQLRNR